MNKKGYYGIMGSIGMLVGLFILVLVCVSLISVQQNTVTPDKMIETISTVEKETLNKFVTTESNGVIVNVVYSFCSFIVYSAIEVSKAGVQYGVAHPEFVNPKTLLWLIIAALLIPVIVGVTKLFLVVFILIKDVVQSKKEKKRLEILKHER